MAILSKLEQIEKSILARDSDENKIRDEWKGKFEPLLNNMKHAAHAHEVLDKAISSAGVHINADVTRYLCLNNFLLIIFILWSFRKYDFDIVHLHLYYPFQGTASFAKKNSCRFFI
jgi:hypothetical protein